MECQSPIEVMRHGMARKGIMTLTCRRLGTFSLQRGLSPLLFQRERKGLPSNDVGIFVQIAEFSIF